MTDRDRARISSLFLIVASLRGEAALANGPPAPVAIGGGTNYVLYSRGKGSAACQPIRDLTVTIKVTEDITSNIGMAFQLNGTSPAGAYQAFQQYIFSLSPLGKIICVDCRPTTYGLFAITEPWPGPAAKGIVRGNIANHATSQRPSFFVPTVPKGFQFTFKLENDHKLNVNKVHYQVTDPQGVKIIDEEVTIADLPPGGHQLGKDGKPPKTIGEGSLSPLVAFQVDLVGPTNGYSNYLSSGAGTITYSVSPATPLVTSQTGLPHGCADSGTSTLEGSNATYGPLGAGPATSYTQGFGVATMPTYTPGGALAASQGKAGHNNVYVVDSNAQLVQFTASSTGEWSPGAAVVSDFLMAGGSGLVALPVPGHGEKTFVLGVEQGGGATAYTSNANGAWDKPVQIPPKHGFTRRRTAVAAWPLDEGSKQVHFFAVNGDGQISASSTDGSGHWNQPGLISPEGSMANAAPVAVAQSFAAGKEMDVFGVNGKGQLLFVTKGHDGKWSHPQFIDFKESLPKSAPLAATREFGSTGKTDVFVVDSEGNLTLFSSIAGGKWSARTIDQPGTKLLSGGHVAASQHFGDADRTDVFAFDTQGRLNGYWIDGKGTLSGPHVLSAAGIAPAGAAIVAMRDTAIANQTDLFFIGGHGHPNMMWSAGNDWKGPKRSAEACAPDYLLDSRGRCAHVCKAPGTKMAADGTCQCVAGAHANSTGGCSSCGLKMVRGTDGACRPSCDKLHSVATAAGTCVCEPGYTIDPLAYCTRCEKGYVAVPPLCVKPSEVEKAECQVAGGLWFGSEVDKCIYPKIVFHPELIPVGE